MRSRAFITRVEKTPGSLRRALDEALDYIGWANDIHRNDRVFLKPNLTWKEHIPGVTVSPTFLTALLEAMRERVNHLTIGESNGGYHGFNADEAFQGHGLVDVCKRLDVKLVNLSTVQRKKMTGTILGQLVWAEVPAMLVDDTDVFMTVPVPKIHAMTHVSIAFKNQWGCMPDVMRLRRHPEFYHTILFLNKILRVHYAVCDGITMLDQNGPMIGVPVEMDTVIAANNPGAASMVGCQIMGIDPWSIKTHQMALKEGMFPASSAEVEVNADPGLFFKKKFVLNAHLTNRVARAAFNSQALTKVIYDSTFGDKLHDAFYTVRRWPVWGRVFYGEVGPPEVKGHR